MSPRESNPVKLTCRLQGGGKIVEVIGAARAFGRSCSLADEDLVRLCIIVEELIANLHDHGGLTDRDEVELTLVAEPAYIHVTIVDPGKAFDPRTAPNSSQPERGGGAGLALVRAWAEIISYEVTGAGNRLELLMPRRS